MLEVRLTRGYFRSARRVLRSGTTAAKRVAAVLQQLSEEPVPADGDVKDLLPPVLVCWSRRVPGTDLAVMFDRNGDIVRVLALRTWP